MIKLENRIMIYVPSADSLGNPIDNTASIDQAMTLLAVLFGGSTAPPESANGLFLSESGNLVGESIRLVYANFESMSFDAWSQVLTLCESLKTRLNQESIGISVNEALYLI